MVTLVADYTKRDAEIGNVLKQLKVDKAGLPVLAVFPAGNPNKPIVMTGVYTQAQLLKVLEDAGASLSATEKVSNVAESKDKDVERAELKLKPASSTIAQKLSGD